jgi:hypothetical protein
VFQVLLLQLPDRIQHQPAHQSTVSRNFRLFSLLLLPLLLLLLLLFIDHPVLPPSLKAVLLLLLPLPLHLCIMLLLLVLLLLVLLLLQSSSHRQVHVLIHTCSVIAVPCSSQRHSQ